jgi:integral membrane sensor domain MASE1
MKLAAHTSDLSYTARPLAIVSGRKRMWQLTCVFAAYLLAGEIGLAVPFTSGNISPFWPPAGVALAAILLFGYRIWPAVALGAFTVNFFTSIPISQPLGLPSVTP